jgi:UDP-N-acetylmuramoyl-tripeptide--D-alanyl-D-alanine ligase
MIEREDLLAAVPGAEILHRGPQTYTKASVDTRSITGGELFFAISGPARDGHDFAAAAADAGAGGVVVSRDAPDLISAVADRTTVVRVPDTLTALQATARVVRERSSASVIGVTGSAGKTTAKTLIAGILAQKYAVLSNAASFNNHLGVPLTLTGIDPEHSHVVAEIGTNHRGEIAHLSGLVAPDVAVITNVGWAHLGNFADQEELAREKTDLFRHAKPAAVWVFNGDDPLLTRTATSLPEADTARLIRVGFGPHSDIRAVDVTVDERGIRGTMIVHGRRHHFALPTSGRHFAYAAMLAVAVGLSQGIEVEVGIEALRQFTPPPGRATLRRVNDHLLVVDDSYNGSPDAMFSALDLLDSLPGTVKIAVLGEMRELGTFSAELHERVGDAAARTATHLITVGGGAAPTRARAASAGLNPAHIDATGSALQAYSATRRIIDAVDPEESTVVLIKGSRFMHMERVYLGLTGRAVTCPLGACTLYINCGDCPKLERG